MAELHGGTSSRIDLMLHSMPLADSEAVRQCLGRCLALVDTLIQNVSQCTAGLPEKERHMVSDMLEGCRGDVQAFRETVELTILTICDLGIVIGCDETAAMQIVNRKCK